MPAPTGPHPAFPSPTGRRSRRAALRRVLLGAIGVLYVASIPWYRSGGEAPEIWFGLPDWVAVAVSCYVAIAVLNALAWLLTDVPDPSVPLTPCDPEPPS